MADLFRPPGLGSSPLYHGSFFLRSGSPLSPTNTESETLVQGLLWTHLSQVLPWLYLLPGFLATHLLLGVKQALYRHGLGTTRTLLSHCPSQWRHRKVMLS